MPNLIQGWFVAVKRLFKWIWAQNQIFPVKRVGEKSEEMPEQSMDITPYETRIQELEAEIGSLTSEKLRLIVTLREQLYEMADLKYASENIEKLRRENALLKINLSNLKQYLPYLMKQIAKLREQLAKAQAEDQYSEYRDLATEIVKNRTIVFGLFEQKSHKIQELEVLDKELAAINKELSAKIFAKGTKENICFKASRGDGEVFEAHANNHNESLGDFINRAIQETLQRDEAELSEAQAVDASCVV